MSNDLIEARQKIVARHASEKETMLARHKEELAQFDSTAKQFAEWLSSVGSSAAAPLPVPAWATLKSEAPGAPRAEAARTPRSGSFSSRLADHIKKQFGPKEHFTKHDVIRTMPEAGTTTSLSGTLSVLKKSGLFHTVGSDGRLDIYCRTPDQMTSIKGGNDVASPTPAAPETGDVWELAEFKTDCARSIRSGVATISEAYFTRVQIKEAMMAFIGEREILGWEQSGAMSITLKAMRDKGILIKSVHQPMGTEFFYEKGPRFS